jgi:hypothetical protein
VAQPFANGDLSYQDQIKLGRAHHVLGKTLSDFLEEFPFAREDIVAQNFGQSKPTIKHILKRELGLQRFSRRWVPHSLSESQNDDRKTLAINILSLIRQQMSISFSRIVTEDESWFLSLYQYDHMFATSRDEVIPRTKQTIGAQKVMLTIFFTGTKLISLNALSPGGRFIQDYFINKVLPDIVHKSRQILRRVRLVDFLCTWTIPCATMVAK